MKFKVGKYKVGDLVTLSAAGRARNGNWAVSSGFGIVIKISRKLIKYPIECHWPEKRDEGKIHFFKPYELKRLRSDKK